jgi:hypothetical protein
MTNLVLKCASIHLAWPPRGTAVPFAWIEHRNGELHSL